MGGNAFTNLPHPLCTPRLPPPLYYSLRDAYISILSHIYTHVATPIEAPEKDSHGDIDILVSDPKSTQALDTVYTALKAQHKFRPPGSPSTSFAVPYPGLPDNYVQVDVHICPPLLFQWEVFTHSHGDLWNILGTSLRPLGLTANDKGLHVRIPEIEEFHRKRSMVFLTADPGVTLEFLGLDREQYQYPFDKKDEMYDSVVGMRLFVGNVYERGTLKANDRKRMKQRAAYREFVDEWLPRWRERGGTTKWPEATREAVLEEVLERFKARKEYEEKIRSWRQEKAEQEAKKTHHERRRKYWHKENEYADAWIGFEMSNTQELKT
ncbi:hypothetical protein MMC20_001290 [Loxospora ochrophaea]|nr:hypothetical protein [Loxospora ochrophaea]